jgi:hypothetical protein
MESLEQLWYSGHLWNDAVQFVTVYCTLLERTWWPPLSFTLNTKTTVFPRTFYTHTKLHCITAPVVDLWPRISTNADSNISLQLHDCS